jgi:antirestriction protein
MFDTKYPTTPRIYAACLASYNNGVLHGTWIDASSDVDEMQEQIDAMLRASKFPNVTVECPDCDGRGRNSQKACSTCHDTNEVPSAEEFAIHDHEGLGNVQEYDSLETIAEYVAILEEFDHIDADDLAAIMSDYSTPADAGEALRDSFCGIFGTFREYADDTADEMIACHTADGTAPQVLVNYFDYESFARDLQMDMHTIDTPSGVAIFHA